MFRYLPCISLIQVVTLAVIRVDQVADNTTLLLRAGEFIGVTAVGVLMLLTELLTSALLAITTAGGAMGGTCCAGVKRVARIIMLPGTGDAKVIGGYVSYCG